MEANWRWIAYGKHPAAKDFFRLGQFGRLVENFSNWVDKGYQLFAARKDIGRNSWRFWTRGSQKDSLSCGVIRDCHDQVGRPYPFLIMGEGILKGWEDHWDVNFLACERTWSQMEYLYTRNFKSVQQMEGEIQKILPPISQALQIKEEKKDSPEGAGPNTGNSSPLFQEMERGTSQLGKTGELFLPLDQLSPDPSTGIHVLHRLLGKEGKVPPHAFFIGGTIEKAFLAVFRRPLVPADFVQLWSVASLGKETLAIQS